METAADKNEDLATETAETEKGFGTGLRAQLARRREGGTPDPADTSPRRAALEEPPVTPAPMPVLSETPVLDAAAGELDALRTQAQTVNVELEMLRQELAASAERERELRKTLAEQLEAYERNLAAEKEVAVREAELGQRASAIENRFAGLDDRNRELAQRERTIAEQ